MYEPVWLAEARKYIGEREIKGAQHNPLILQFWKDIRRSGIRDDETPWCAAFVGAVLERCGILSSRYESAKSYLQWGRELKEPGLGCVVVLLREGGGHVGFVVGTSSNQDLMVLGGNQSDAVNIRAFSRCRISSYRWPTNVSEEPHSLPILTAQYSGSES